MKFSRREKEVWEEIIQWEKENVFQNKMTRSLYFEKYFQKFNELFPDEEAKSVLPKLDLILFYLQSIAQQYELDEQARKDILDEARFFRSDIYHMEDVRKLTIDQLRHITNKICTKQRLIAFMQGAFTGTGGMLFTLSDLTFMFMINLRLIQLIALTYSYEVKKPFETMVVLKLFHAITLPKTYRRGAWEQLFQEIKSQNREAFFYEGEEEIVSKQWLHQPLFHLFKLFLFVFLRKKFVYRIPIASMLTGAMINFRFTNHVSKWSHYFYQKRWLMEKAE